MGALDRTAILAAEDLVREAIEVPEWGGTVWVGTMSGLDRDAWEQALAVKGDGKAPDLRNLRARLAVLTVTDEAGKRLFAASDIDALGQKSSLALDRIARVAQRLNGLTPEALEAAKGN